MQPSRYETSTLPLAMHMFSTLPRLVSAFTFVLGNFVNFICDILWRVLPFGRVTEGAKLPERTGTGGPMEFKCSPENIEN